MSQQVQSAAQKNTRLARVLVRAAAVMNMVLLFMMCANASHGGAIPIALFALGIDIAVAAFAIKNGLLFELLIEKIWKKTCSGLGGNFVGLGRAQFHTKVAFDPISSFQKGEWKRKTIYPKIREVRGSWKSWTGVIRPFYGQNIDDYNQQANRFALAFHVPFVTFDLSENGLIRIRAGQVPVPAAYGFQGQLQVPSPASNTRLLQQTASPSLLSEDELPEGVLQAAEEFQRRRGKPISNVYIQDQRDNVWAAELALLKGVPIARDLDGHEVKLPIEGQHWFVAARTGGGKGSWVWSLVLGLAPAHRLG